MKTKNEKKSLFQGKAMHPFIPLLFMVVLCTVISYFVAPGAYDRETVNGVTRVIADSYHTVERTPVDLFNMFRSIPEGLTATAKDITDNPHGYVIKEMEAALIPNYLDECAIAVINGNYAIAAELDFTAALAVEDKNSEAAKTFANVLVVKEGNEQKEAILALKECLLSQEVKTFIENTYGGAVVPSF